MVTTIRNPWDDREQAREIQQIHAIPEFLADASGDDTEDRRSANIDSHENNGVESVTGGNIGQRSRGASPPLRLPVTRRRAAQRQGGADPSEQ